MTLLSIIYPDGKITAKEVDLPAKPSYEELRDLLTPIFSTQRPQAWFEHVSIRSAGKNLDMFVDEIGALIPLPINPHATKLYLGPKVTSILKGPFIYGLAVIFDRKVWF